MMTEIERLAATARRLEAELETLDNNDPDREVIIRSLNEIQIRFDDLMRAGLA